MKLSRTKVCDILQAKGVTRLFHANSVLTSCSFLREGALLSRGSVEQLGLDQTQQGSDELDRRYDIWFDIFLDTIDIHDRASRENVYGPVLFELDIDVLKQNDVRGVWVTRFNPTKWGDIERRERWFESRKKLEEEFDPTEFDQMIVLPTAAADSTSEAV